MTLSWWRSVEITSGLRPAAISASAVSYANEPVPWPMSMMTPESHARRARRRAAARRRRRSSSSGPVKQCVRMSPGRISASTSSIAGGPNAMCTISGSSHSSAARRARRSGSRPFSPTVGVPIRTLTPRTRSRLRVGEAPEEVDVEVGEVRALVVLADEPDVRDVEERRDAHARAARRRTPRSPGSVSAPAEPASFHVVTPDDRGDRIGIDAPVGDLVEDVRVQVDEARA